MAADNQQHRPALIIGLGGTGKQVLLNLRRMLFEKYGEPTLPHIANLWIDTDPRNITLDGKEMNFLMKEVNFEKNEKLDIELKRADVLNYYESMDNYPHIFSWLDKQTKKLPPIENGAGAVRCIGKLAFFHHFKEINDRLIETRKVLEKATSHQEAHDKYDIDIDSSSLDVWLVFSVAGGTGSGIFLDLAYAIRHLWPNVNIRAMIVLPSVFSSDHSDRIYANSYAALMELEHYSFDKEDINPESQGDQLHRYPASWTKKMYEAGTPGIVGQVFDMTYLIDNRSSGGGLISVEDKDCLCRMLAERLYIEHAGGSEVENLGTVYRSEASNFATAQVRPIIRAYEEYDFEELFSCRFASFGLSKLYIPIRRIHLSGRYKLVKDLIDFWTRDEQPPPNLDALISKEYAHTIGVSNTNKAHDIINAIEHGTDSERLSGRLHKIIWGEKRGRFIAGSGRGDIRSAINQWVEKELIDEQLNKDHVVKAKRGTLSKILEHNAEIHYKQVVNNLDEFISTMLAQQGYRFDVAREVLRRIRSQLLRDEENYSTRTDKMRQSCNRLISNTQRNLDWLNDISSFYTRKVLVEVTLENIEKRVKTELKAQINEKAAQLCRKIADYIGHGHTEENAQGEKVVIETGLIKRLVDYQRQLREMLPEVNDRYNAFIESDTSPINQDISHGKKEIDRYYVDQTGKAIVEETLAEWEQKFFEEQEQDGAKDLWDMREILKKEGSIHVIENMTQFAQNTLPYVNDQSDADVLSRLAEKHPINSDGFETAVRRLLVYSAPWLSKDNIHSTEKEQMDNNQKEVFLVARKQGISPEMRQFEELLKQQTSTSPTLVSTTIDRIYSTQTRAGVALMSIPNLERYRNQAYYDALKIGDFIHTDLAFEKFQDLLSKKPTEISAYIDVLKTFLQAILMGSIEADYEQHRAVGTMLSYRYINRNDLYEQTTNLGPFSVAIQVLLRPESKAILEDIKTQIYNLRIEMNDNSQLRWYTLLQFHANDKKSFFNRFPERSAIRRTLSKLANEIYPAIDEDIKIKSKVQLDNINSWTVEQPENSGLKVLKIL